MAEDLGKSLISEFGLHEFSNFVHLHSQQHFELVMRSIFP